MQRILKKCMLVLPIVFIMIILLTACGGKGGSIVGTWNSEDGEEVLIFDKDGICSVPFTYDAAWLESRDNYSMDDKGTLVLSGSKGNIGPESYARQASKESVEKNGGYYLSGDTLILLDHWTFRSYTRQ